MTPPPSSCRPRRNTRNLPAAETDVAKLFGRVVKFAAVIFAGSAAVVRVLIEQRLGFLDSRQREVMRLNAIAIIFPAIKSMRDVCNTPTTTNERDRNAPEEADEDGGAMRGGTSGE